MDTSASLHAQGPGGVDRDTLPDHLVLFASLHDAMRRDARRLELAVPAVGSAADAQALLSWWGRFAGVISHHHRREDDVVWPELERRSPRFALEQMPLHDDHAALDRAMDAVGRALATMAGDPADLARARSAAIEVAGDFRRVLGDHLDREELLVFPLLATTFTAEEYAVLEKELRKGTSLRAVAFELPWLLDGAPVRVATLADDAVPPVMKVLLRFSWLRSYRRVSAPVRGVA